MALAKKKKSVADVLDEQIDRVVVLQAERAVIDELLTTAKDDLYADMLRLDIHSHRTVAGHGATRVEGSSVNIDTDQLKKRIGAVLWGKITVRKVDNKKLDDAIARNVIDPVVVAAVSTETPTKPYVRITPSKQGATP